MEFIILRSSDEEGNTKTVLVNADSFEGKPADYFTPAFTANAEKVGVVMAEGDTDQLDDVYETAW